MKKTCGNCEHCSEDNDGSRFLCFRFPPQMFSHMREIKSMRPEIKRSDAACGEWKEKKAVDPDSII